MTTSGITLEGKYFDGESPVPRQAVLTLGESGAVLSGVEAAGSHGVNTLVVSPRIGGADRFVTFPDGGQCQCADHPFLDRLVQEVKSEGPVAWLEDRYSVAVASVAVIACALLLGYFYGLPAVADSVVDRIPVETEVRLGESALAWLDGNDWFSASQLKRERRDTVTERFSRLHEGLAMSPNMKLVFRDSDLIGPNSFALPGGLIVMTDQMVALADSDEEILAILAHEIGHAEERHGMRQLLQSSGIALLVATVTSDAATVSTTVAGLPAILAQTKYSRDFERTADDYAFDILLLNGISPGAFADIMERLDKYSGMEEAVPFLSTHPLSSERIERARAAAQ